LINAVGESSPLFDSVEMFKILQLLQKLQLQLVIMLAAVSERCAETSP